MKIRRPTIAGVGTLAAGAAMAYEGHGLPGASHWHAIGVFGLVLVVAAAAGVGWLGCRT